MGLALLGGGGGGDTFCLLKRWNGFGNICIYLDKYIYKQAKDKKDRLRWDMSEKRDEHIGGERETFE